MLPHRLHWHVLQRCPRPAERQRTSYRVVLKVQQVVRQASMFATQLPRLIHLSVRLALPSEQVSERSSGSQPGQVRDGIAAERR